jgi:hypothetical protein
VGVIVTIITVFASSFNQQAISQELRKVQTGNTTISRTDSVILKNVPGSEGGYSVVGKAGIKGATYLGLWTNFTKSIVALEPLCSTGNCTWPESYLSVGVCAQMADVSHLIKEHDPTLGSLVRELPNGAFLDISATGVNALNITTKTPTLAFQDVPSDHIVADIFVIIDYSVGQGTNTSAVELLLSFCTREYNTSVSNGRALSTETILERDKNVAFGELSNRDPLEISGIFQGSTSDGMPTTDTAALFAQAAYTPPYKANLLAMMKNTAISLTNRYGDILSYCLFKLFV